MTYFSFHLTFILPPIVLMGATLPRAECLRGSRARLAIPLISLVALTYTIPWDNYLVAQQIWWYGADRVLMTIGFVPIEEYLFFVLQPVLTGLFLFQYLGRWSQEPDQAGAASAWLGFFLFLVLAAGGGLLLFLEWPPGTYMGLVLAWACPLLAGMWLYGGRTLWARRRLLAYTVGFPTLYLWVADATAIRTGIWTISSKYTLGLSISALPIEEATFFLMTNMLVIKGILLLLHEPDDY